MYIAIGLSVSQSPYFVNTSQTVQTISFNFSTFNSTVQLLFRMRRDITKFCFGPKTIKRFFRELGRAQSQNWHHYTPARKAKRIMLWQWICFLSDCTELFFGHVFGSKQPQKWQKECLSAFFVHSPGGRCNWLSSMKFLCTCIVDLQDMFFILKILWWFLEFGYVFLNIFVLHYPVVAVTDLARWNFLHTLYNWFARPHFLFIFTNFWVF